MAKDGGERRRASEGWEAKVIPANVLLHYVLRNEIYHINALL